MFLFLFRFLFVGRAVYFKDVEWPLFFNAVLYSSFVKLKISSFDELSDNLRQTDDGIWRIIGGGWLDEVCMYNNLSSGFLNGRYVPSMRLNVTLRKSTIFKFAFISILKPMSLKFFVMSFLALSICLPLCSRRSISPSSRYSPVSSFLILSANL